MIRILIVDDEPSVRFLYEEIIKLLGYEMAGAASNGDEAITMFKAFSKKPDIILMDHRMPKKNGIETTKEILQLNKQAKIIFTSADLSIKEEALSLGALSFKEKPFTINNLKNNIINAINKNIKIKV